MAPSVVPFRSLPKCPLLCEEYPALLSDLFCLWHLSPFSIPYHTFYLFPMLLVSPQENVSSLRAGIFIFVSTTWNGAQ